LFVQTQSFKETAKQFLNLSIKKIHRLIIPYILMIIGLVLVIYIVPLLLFLPAAIYTIWYVLVFVVYFSWTKYYLYALINPEINSEKAVIPAQKQKVHKQPNQKKEKKQ
jgi:carbon starvation protein CstA